MRPVYEIPEKDVLHRYIAKEQIFQIKHLRPSETIMVLVSDLYEGGNQTEMLKRAASIAASGVNSITLLALDDKGAPFFDHHVAAQFAGFGVPVFACTPDLFPDLMAAAIRKRDIWQWAGTNDIVVNQ